MSPMIFPAVVVEGDVPQRDFRDWGRGWEGREKYLIVSPRIEVSVNVDHKWWEWLQD